MTVDLKSVLNNKSIWFTDKYNANFAEGTKERELLNVFSYGTWEDYLKIKDSLPDNLKLEPNSIAVKKLKGLSILSIMEDKISFSIDELMKILNIDNFVDAETIVIDLFGSELLVGKIDEKTHTLSCKRVAARCIENAPEAIDNIISDINIIRDRIASINEIE